MLFHGPATAEWIRERIFKGRGALMKENIAPLMSGIGMTCLYIYQLKYLFALYVMSFDFKY